MSLASSPNPILVVASSPPLFTYSCDYLFIKFYLSNFVRKPIPSIYTECSSLIYPTAKFADACSRSVLDRESVFLGRVETLEKAAAAMESRRMRVAINVSQDVGISADYNDDLGHASDYSTAITRWRSAQASWRINLFLAISSPRRVVRHAMLNMSVIC